MTYGWLIALIVFVVIELSTVNLLTIWFAIGSLFALIATILGAQLWLQITVFIVFSAIILLFLRPLAKNFINKSRQPTNADRVIGKICPVVEEINNVTGTGAISVGGKTWTARSESGAVVTVGSLVKPIKIDGVKLIVEPIKETADVN